MNIAIINGEVHGQKTYITVSSNDVDNNATMKSGVDLIANVQFCLNEFERVHGVLPDHIIVTRSYWFVYVCI